MSASDQTRLRLYRELGLSPVPATDTDDDWSDEQWEILNQAIDIALGRMRVRLEVAMHVRRLLPCDAIVQAGILSPAELGGQIAEGRFDGQLCALPLASV